MIDVKRPRLLDSSLNETAVLKPLGLQLALQTPGVSTAVLTLNPNDPEPQMHSWIELYNQNGSVGIFRVTSPTTDYAQQSAITLRHGIDSFADSVLKVQMEFTGTPTQLLTRMINAQTTLINGVAPWTLGTVAATRQVKMSLNYNRLSDLLENLEEELEGYYFEYDQSVFPWVINVVAAPSNADCEFRLNRNVMTINRTLNDNDLCTQLILSINNKSTSEEITSVKSYIKTYNNATAQATYGIVQKTADIDTDDDLTVTTEQPIPDTPEADAWAARFLADHAAPTIQLQISAKELKRITGDTWDETKLGHMCRVAMPSHSQTFTERVVNVTYPDALGQPDVVNVSLANQLPKFSSTIASLRAENARLSRSTRSVARSSASVQEQEYWSQRVQYYGLALDGTGVLTLYESGIDMSPTGGVKIYSLQEGVQSLYAGITVNTGEIASIVQKSGINNLGVNETLYSKITQNATAINLKVSKGAVATQLSVECGNVSISGGDLVVDGYVTADSIFSSTATHYDIYASDLYADSITLSGTGLLDAESVVAGSVTAVDELYLGSVDMADAVIGFGTVTSSGGQITIPYSTVGGGGNITFNIADTAYYQSHIGIASTGSWVWDSDESDYVREITPNDGFPASVTLPSITVSANTGTNQSFAVYAYGPPSGGVVHDVSLAQSFYLQSDANYVYVTNNSSTPTVGTNVVARIANPGSGQAGIASIADAGWTYSNNAYRNTITATANDGTTASTAVTLPSITCDANRGTSASVTVQAYGPTVLGDQYSISNSGKTFYLKSDNNYVYLTNTNSTPTVGTNVVARAANSAQTGISTITRNQSSNSTSTYTGWSTDQEFSTQYQYLRFTATANDGTTRTFKINAAATYVSGRNSPTIDDFDLNGSSSATAASKPTTALSKSPSTISGYKWFRLNNGSWKNLGAFSISTGFIKVPETLYTYDPEDGYQQFGTAYIFTG